ncbi:hypothetical protein P7K49_036163 [Saguinus oedipus]|uniref:Uncharacterized protein n=1 Tax=Saguinus oedipus TaxID=9490 RepID=A0ABQ9TQR5_SAGOE|nr:hypothetical protein P7K49_036163 [Saguinus oedipus]
MVHLAHLLHTAQRKNLALGGCKDGGPLCLTPFLGYKGSCRLLDITTPFVAPVAVLASANAKTANAPPAKRVSAGSSLRIWWMV